MKRRLVLLIVVLTVALPWALSQQPNSAKESTTIAGAVVQDQGSQPLKKVLLQLIAEDQKQGANYSARTDADGHFHIDNVQPGRYRLFLEKTGFVQINEHHHQVEDSVFEVKTGQQMNQLLFQMLPTAVITGRVVDEDGDPLSGFGISVQRKGPGKSRPGDSFDMERTNDLGEYRIAGLFPGQYFVSVVPTPDYATVDETSKGNPDPERRPDSNYLTTYYPGTTDATQATAVSLRAGDEMPVDFNLTPARTYRVHGTVAGAFPGQKPTVQLISKSLNSITMNAAEVADNGEFELRGIAPGSYWITAFSGSEGETLSARQSVSVSTGDVEGLKLIPVRPFMLSGHMNFEGALPKDISGYTVYLQSADGADDAMSIAFMPGNGPLAKVGRGGNFQWTGVTPGRYTVQVNGGDSRDAFLRSVVLGGRDTITGFFVSGPASIEITISSRGGVLEGSVVDHDRPVSNATVVAVPEAKYRKIHDRFGVGATDQNGRFVIHGLAPGEYAVFAWQDLEDGLFYDLDFLKSQEGNGTALPVQEGSHQQLQLKLSAVSDEWR